MIKLTREEFYYEIVKPIAENDYIKNNHKFVFYWNGNEAKKKGYSLTPNLLGSVYNITNRKTPVILMKYQKNQYNMVDTLLHELGHLMLKHSTKYSNKMVNEIEAETVSKYTLEYLNLEFKDDSYINKNKKRYLKYFNKEYIMEETRKKELKKISKILSNILINKVDILQELQQEQEIQETKTTTNPNKYVVICEKCNTKFYYKRNCLAIKSIKNNEKNYYCPNCSSKELVVKFNI